MRERIAFRRALMVLALGVVPMLGACGQPTPSGPLPAGQPTTVVTAPAGSIVPKVTAHVDGEAHGILSSADDSVLWVPVFTGQEVLLDQFDNAGASVKHIVLGSSQSSGINGHIRMAPDGSIWISDDYVLFRYDPTTGTVGTLRLEVDDPNAIAGALSNAVPLPGTWVSAFTFDAAGDLLVARNNVPVLELLSPSGHLMRTLALSDGITGVSDMDLRPDGLHLLVGRPADVSEEISPVIVKVDVSAPQSALPAALRSALLGLTQVFLPNGDSVRTNSAGAATLVSSAGSSHDIALRSKDEQIANPLGKLVTVTVREHVIGAGTSKNDTVWVLLSAIGGGTDLAQLP